VTTGEFGKGMMANKRKSAGDHRSELDFLRVQYAEGGLSETHIKVAVISWGEGDVPSGQSSWAPGACSWFLVLGSAFLVGAGEKVESGKLKAEI
jgi:hypothetical protein